MYDIFYMSKERNHRFKELRKRFPFLKFASYENKKLEAINKAKEKSLSSFFWIIDNDNVVDLNFQFDYEVIDWDKDYVHIFKQLDGNFGGVYLLAKDRVLTNEEIEYNFFHNTKNIDVIASSQQLYDQFVIERPEDYFTAQEQCSTSMFFAIPKDFKKSKDFNYIVPEWDEKYVHIFENNVFLIPKEYPISKKEAEYNFFIVNKKIDIVAFEFGYDQFIIKSPKDYFTAQTQCKTSMFFAVPQDYGLLDDFEIIVPEWDKKYVHMFKEKNQKHGVVNLIPKDYIITKKEAEHDFFISKKEIQQNISKLKYDQFIITSSEDYFTAQKQCTTSMFYAIPEDFMITDTSFCVESWDKKYVHVFKEKDQKHGIVNLIPKDYPITEKEAKNNFFINKKVIEKKISLISYDQFVIETIEDYFTAQKQCTTSMFYAIPKDYVSQDNLNYYIEEWDKKYVHMFKEKDQTHGVVNLIPKEYSITQKEAKNNFFINKKVIEKNISKIAYERFIIKDPKDYYVYQEKCRTSMFYAIDRDYTIQKDFSYTVNEWDKKYVHVFKNTNDQYEGLLLIPKDYEMTDKETKYDFFINKKEIDIIASKMLFDIIFISYNEPNADENFKKLQERFPRAKRVHGVKGIHRAHIAAAKVCDTRMFWAVDGDAIINNDFNFDLNVSKWDKDVVYVFRSMNPINDLVYGYGGVKLLPTQLVLDMDINSVDMTTSISKKFKAIDQISNITAFNTDPFNTWKSAFRECVKLSSKIIDGQIDEDTQKRLDIWCLVGIDKKFGEYAIKGAKTGREFGTKYANNKEMLSKINDWEWLQNEFKQ